MIDIELTFDFSVWHVFATLIMTFNCFAPDKTPPEYLEGNPFWLSREEYVLFGCESLEQ